MRFLSTALISLTLLSFAKQTQAQGLIDGFMRGQRKASLAVFGSRSTYDTYFVNTTETKNPNLGTVTTEALTVVGTYGLGYDLDLIVAAPYIRTQSSAGYSPKQEGFQDVSAALRWEAFDYKIGRARLSWHICRRVLHAHTELCQRCAGSYWARLQKYGWPHDAAPENALVFPDRSVWLYTKRAGQPRSYCQLLRPQSNESKQRLKGQRARRN